MTGTRFTVCLRCEGRGSHVNPAVDGHGITADEMDELGDDFRDDYVSGVYDVPCSECGGLRVVPMCCASVRLADGSGRLCGEPIAAGTFVDDDGTGRPYSGCWDHLLGDEREQHHDNLQAAAMQAAEIRAGC